MPVNHKFVSQKPDSANTSLIRPSNWNDSHTGLNGEVHIPLIILAEEKTF